MTSTTAPVTHTELSYVEKARQDAKETEGTGPIHPSLATCARRRTPNSDLRIEQLLDDRIDLAVSSGLNEVAEYAVEYGNYRDDYTKRVVAALLNRREFDTARNIASCGNEFDKERGTSSTCANSRLCSDCRTHPGGKAQSKYADKAVAWPRHTFLALTMPEPYDDPVRGREAFLDSFKSLKGRKLSLTDSWLKELGDRDREFAETLRRDYFDEGHSVPFFDNNEPSLVEAGICGVHVEQSGDEFRVHGDLLGNARRLDYDVSGDKWRDCGGGAMSLQRVYPKGNDDKETAVRKTVAYCSDKQRDFTDVDDRVDYALAVDGNTYHKFGM